MSLKSLALSECDAMEMVWYEKLEPLPRQSVDSLPLGGVTLLAVDERYTVLPPEAVFRIAVYAGRDEHGIGAALPDGGRDMRRARLSVRCG